MNVRLVTISVCANLALAIFATHLRTRDHGPVLAPAKVPALQRASHASGTVRSSDPEDHESPPFHWSSLESTNFEVYVANLRAVGCPESTVRDIVFGELADLYAQKQLSRIVAAPFWSCGAERKAADKPEQLDGLELEREGREWVQRLLGADAQPLSEDSDWVKDFQQYGIGRALLGPMPRQTLLSFFALAKTFEAAESDMRDETGLVLPEDTKRVRQSLLEACGKVKMLMSAEQFNEICARCFALRFGLESHSDERFTSQELRAIARMQVAAFGLERIFLEHFPLPDEAEREQTFEQGLRAYLGEARYERYTRSKDWGYKQVLGFTHEQGLPEEIAVALSDTQKVLQEESSKVLADASISSRERRMLLTRMQTEVQAQAASLLGQTPYAQYLGKGGGWLTNAIVLP